MSMVRPTRGFIAAVVAIVALVTIPAVALPDNTTVRAPLTGCPVKLGADALPVVNNGSDLAHHLVPVTPPTGVSVCQYQANTSTPGPGTPLIPVLVKTVRLTALPATQMAKVISAISLKSEGKSGCPNAIFGDDVLVQFSYPARTPVTLLYAASGCRYLTNGRRTGYETANPSFYNGFMTLMTNVAGVQ
jgi:hypothetical protein